jgi:hypothetical protein
MGATGRLTVGRKLTSTSTSLHIHKYSVLDYSPDGLNSIHPLTSYINTIQMPSSIELQSIRDQPS